VVNVAGATSTSVVIGGLGAGTYYFAVAALNSLGEESDRSNSASLTVP
jgi:hypothetical protein